MFNFRRSFFFTVPACGPLAAGISDFITQCVDGAVASDLIKRKQPTTNGEMSCDQYAFHGSKNDAGTHLFYDHAFYGSLKAWPLISRLAR